MKKAIFSHFLFKIVKLPTLRYLYIEYMLRQL